MLLTAAYGAMLTNAQVVGADESDSSGQSRDVHEYSDSSL